MKSSYRTQSCVNARSANGIRALAVLAFSSLYAQCFGLGAIAGGSIGAEWHHPGFIRRLSERCGGNGSQPQPRDRAKTGIERGRLFFGCLAAAVFGLGSDRGEARLCEIRGGQHSAECRTKPQPSIAVECGGTNPDNQRLGHGASGGSNQIRSVASSEQPGDRQLTD